MKLSGLQIIPAVLALSCSVALANTQHAHVHGELELQFVQQGEQLSMRLYSPLANIVGFEYQPTEPEDKWQLNQAIDRLSAVQWLKTAKVSCKPENVQVSYSWQQDDAPAAEHGHNHDHDKHEHHDHDKHEHHDHDKHEHHEHDKHEHHEHDKHEHHEHEHHDHDNHGHDGHEHHDTHASVTIDYELACSRPLTSELSVELFALFPAIERIQAQWISDNGQGGKVLTAAQTQLQL